MKLIDTSHLRGDVFGGLTAGIVALPLALAFGEASGAGPIAGLWGAVFVGFFAALFGGTKTQVSGPTGPMVVVFAGVFSSLSGEPALVFASVILAGIFQILFGVFRFGQYIRLVPYPVISGFMSGIGCIIIALQLSRLFGHEPEASGTIPALAAIPGAIANPNIAALSIGLVTLAVIFTWPKKLGKYVPGALAALIIGTLLSLVLKGAPILGDIPTGLPSFVVPAFSQSTFFVVVEAAFILAILGAIDSLLTSLVADNMTRDRHNSNRELIGQGIGNTVAGFFGAIPGAGATMRTVVNIRSGGKTNISGMLHSIILVVIILIAAPLASQIPHAVLAGILVKVGYDILDIAYLKRAHKGPRWDLALMALVLGLTVFVDLITAVGVGVVLAALAFVKKMADDQLVAFGEAQPRVTTPEERDLLSASEGRVTMFDFGGPLSFGAAADLGHRVRERVKDHTSAIVLDFSRVPFIDVSAARAVETIACDAKQSGKRVYISGMTDEIREVLSGLNADHCIENNTRYENRIDALRDAAKWVKSDDASEANAIASPGSTYSAGAGTS
ncbi:SulP family inorganic anion transporter [Hyphococcus formosus]|uniref:SulP family inorganic anion transporter n=1 Tax=Hyphococcus formosus TaxID=3143534 RepID=UPI00398B5B45